MQSFDVLVVDDDHEVRDLLVEHFRRRDHKVAATGDGRAAIAAIQRDPTRYGLIVTDLQLPGADGIAVLDAARQANPSIYVIILTGYASLDSAIQAVRLGAYDYLTKPFSLGQIDVILQRITDRLALESENRRLSRQAHVQLQADVKTGIPSQLDAIELRLSRIEATLRQLAERR
jgi:two-component system response regulator AtoC